VRSAIAGRPVRGNDANDTLMLQKILAVLAGSIIATISSAGYLGIVALMAIESACIPLPSEIIMPFSGYLVSTGRFDLLLVATAGAIGCNLGSTIAYAIGDHGGRPLIEKWGAYVLIGRGDLDRVDRFFARYGSIAVLVGRLLPVIRTFIALPAGVARMPRLRFQIYTFLGSWSCVMPLHTLASSWASAGTAIRGSRRFCTASTHSLWRPSSSGSAGTYGGIGSTARAPAAESSAWSIRIAASTTGTRGCSCQPRRLRLALGSSGKRRC